MSLSISSLTPTLASPTSTASSGATLASRFGVQLKSKTSWADMSDDDSDDESVNAFVAATRKALAQREEATPQPPQQPTLVEVAPTTTTATATILPQPTSVTPAPATSSPKVNQWNKTPSLVKAAPIISPLQRAISTPSVTQAAAPPSISLATDAPAALPLVKSSSSVAAPAVVAPKKESFKTWGELTSSLGSKRVSPFNPSLQPRSTHTEILNVKAITPVGASALLPAGLAMDEDDSNAPSRLASSTYDPEIDESKLGLNLAFKGVNTTTSETSVLMEDSVGSKSKQGTKRKGMATTEEEQAIVAVNFDMTQIVAGMKTESPKSISSAIAKPPVVTKPAWNGAGLKKPVVVPESIPAEVQQPATGKKIKVADGSAAHTTSPAKTSPVSVSSPSFKPLLVRPNSFLSAVTGAVPASATSGTTPSDPAHRLQQRRKQIALGKNTPEYQNYIRLVPTSQRLPTHPRTPDIHKSRPKRAMDGLVRTWRRLLHEFDPAVMEAKANGTFVEVNIDQSTSASESEGEMVDAPSDQSSEAASEDDFVLVKPQ